MDIGSNSGIPRIRLDRFANSGQFVRPSQRVEVTAEVDDHYQSRKDEHQQRPEETHEPIPQDDEEVELAGESTASHSGPDQPDTESKKPKISYIV